jgi:hypothetical protein
VWDEGDEDRTECGREGRGDKELCGCRYAGLDMVPSFVDTNDCDPKAPSPPAIVLCGVGASSDIQDMDVSIPMSDSICDEICIDDVWVLVNGKPVGFACRKVMMFKKWEIQAVSDCLIFRPLSSARANARSAQARSVRLYYQSPLCVPEGPPCLFWTLRG